MVPSPKKSRQSKYWSKKYKEDAEFRKKESEQKNKSQKEQRLEMTETEKEEERLKRTLYQREYRQKQKQKKLAAAMINMTPGPSSSNATLGLSPKSNMKRKTGFRSRPSPNESSKETGQRGTYITRDWEQSVNWLSNAVSLLALAQLLQLILQCQS